MRYNRIGIDTEDFSQRLNVMKETLEVRINELQALRQFMQKYDGKMLNKNIIEDIKKGGKYSAYIYKPRHSDRKRLVVEVKGYRLPEAVLGWYVSENLFDYYVDIEGKELEVNRRFNFAGFDTVCREYVQLYRKYLAQTEKDLLDGLERLREAEQVARYYSELVKGFSDFAKCHYRQAFEQTRF